MTYVDSFLQVNFRRLFQVIVLTSIKQTIITSKCSITIKKTQEKLLDASHWSSFRTAPTASGAVVLRCITYSNRWWSPARAHFCECLWPNSDKVSTGVRAIAKVDLVLDLFDCHVQPASWDDRFYLQKIDCKNKKENVEEAGSSSYDESRMYTKAMTWWYMYTRFYKSINRSKQPRDKKKGRGLTYRIVAFQNHAQPSTISISTMQCTPPLSFNHFESTLLPTIQRTIQSTLFIPSLLSTTPTTTTTSSATTHWWRDHPCQIQIRVGRTMHRRSIRIHNIL